MADESLKEKLGHTPSSFLTEIYPKGWLHRNSSFRKLTLVELKIYNTAGQVVRTLVAEDKMVKGNYSVVWDGKNDKGQNVASGLYLCSLRAGDFTATRKMLVLR